MADFDVKNVSTYEWLGVGAGAVALINSFLPFLSVGDATFSISVNSWQSGFFAYASVLVLIAAAVVILLPHFGVAVPNKGMIWLGLAGAAVLFTVLALLVNLGGGVGPSIGWFIGLVAAGSSAAGAFLTYKQTTAPTT